MKKSISLESIILIDGTELRENIDESRIEYFRDLYPQQHSEKSTNTVPPLDVFLIQTGEPSKNRYALLDGRHRLTAAKRNKMKVIDVYIHNIDKTLTIRDLDSRDVIKTIFSESCRLNATHGLPLTSKDRGKAVFRLMELGCTPEEIISTGVVSKRSYFRIVKPETQKNKESRNKKIQEVNSLKKQGVTFRKIAEQVEEKEDTVKKWFKRGDKVPDGTLSPPVDEGDDNKSKTRTKPFVDDNSTTLLYTVYEHIREIGRNKSVEKRIINDILPLLRSKFSSVSHLIPEPLESKDISNKDQNILDAMKNAISQINDTEYTDHKVVTDIIPVLRAKFPGVSSLINDSAYSSQIEELDARCKTLIDELNKKHNTKLSYENQIQELRTQLDDRKKHCSYRCEFTKESLKKEFEKYVDFLMKTVTKHIESFDSICSKDMSIIKELTMDLALPLVSVLEWGAFTSLTNEKTGAIIDDLQKILDSSHIINKDIVYRLNKVRKIIEKSHSTDTESDHSLTGTLN